MLSASHTITIAHHSSDHIERPKVRTIEAAAATGIMVQLRMRPREEGSTMSPGRDDRNSAISAVYSASVRTPEVVDALLTGIAVDPIPDWFINFQIGPLVPSTLP